MSMRVVTSSRILVGIFVGGRATRLGGFPKGLLCAPDTGEPIVRRLARICGEALPGCRVSLVGSSAHYDALGLPAIADEPRGIGPIGGLVALLEHATRDGRDAIALAADLPFVSPELVVRLAEHAPESAAVAPRTDDFWQPLFARYRSPIALESATRVVASGGRALHRVLDDLGPEVAPLPLTPSEAPLLRDWDTADDLLRR